MTATHALDFGLLQATNSISCFPCNEWMNVVSSLERPNAPQSSVGVSDSNSSLQDFNLNSTPNSTRTGASVAGANGVPAIRRAVTPSTDPNAR